MSSRHFLVLALLTLNGVMGEDDEECIVINAHASECTKSLGIDIKLQLSEALTICKSFECPTIRFLQHKGMTGWDSLPEKCRDCVEFQRNESVRDMLEKKECPALVGKTAEEVIKCLGAFAHPGGSS